MVKSPIERALKAAKMVSDHHQEVVFITRHLKSYIVNRRHELNGQAILYAVGPNKQEACSYEGYTV